MKIKIVDLIGTKWVSGGKGPHEFDCWGLAQYWYREQLGIKLPEYPADADKVMEVARTLNKEVKTSAWTELSSPEPNCLVVMGRNTSITHVGVYLKDGAVLHCSREARRTIIQTLHRLSMYWGTIKFYIPNDQSNPV